MHVAQFLALCCVWELLHLLQQVHASDCACGLNYWGLAWVTLADLSSRICKLACFQDYTPRTACHVYVAVRTAYGIPPHTGRGSLRSIMFFTPRPKISSRLIDGVVNYLWSIARFVPVVCVLFKPKGPCGLPESCPHGHAWVIDVCLHAESMHVETRMLGKTETRKNRKINLLCCCL